MAIGRDWSNTALHIAQAPRCLASIIEMSVTVIPKFLTRLSIPEHDLHEGDNPSPLCVIFQNSDSGSQTWQLMHRLLPCASRRTEGCASLLTRTGIKSPVRRSKRICRRCSAWLLHNGLCGSSEVSQCFAGRPQRSSSVPGPAQVVPGVIRRFSGRR